MNIIIQAIDKETGEVKLEGSLQFWFTAVAETRMNPYNNDKLEIVIKNEH